MVGSLAKNKNFDVKNVPKMMEMDTFSEKSGSAAQAQSSVKLEPKVQLKAQH